MATFGVGVTAAGGGGFTLGTQKTTSPFSLPNMTTATTTTGSSPSFSFNPKPTLVTSTGLTGFNFGNAAKTTAAGGFNFGGSLGGTTTTASGGGLSLGTGLGGLGAATSTTSSTGTGFSFGTIPSLGGLGGAATAATTGSTGLNLGTSAGFSFGLGSAVSSTAPTLGLSLGTTTTNAAGNIFTTATTAPEVTGLGGLDPTTSKSGSSGGTASGSDGKAIKETFIPDVLVATVDELQNYVKAEKNIRGEIVRMSSKPMMRVQEDIAALKQLLSVISNGLQRTACKLEKLKTEMTQELKNAEMAQRTKDIPAGLQYENTAPNEYFEHLVEQFESHMLSYKQQIETLESHLSALQQPVRQSPAEIFTLIKRQHETFVALAGQLQQVHEAIKAQKEQFSTYRRIFHGETKDLFPSGLSSVMRPASRRQPAISGPTPFPGVNNAMAMASVLKGPPHSQGPPVAGLLSGTGSSWLSSGIGSGVLSHAGTSFLGPTGSSGLGGGLTSTGMFGSTAGAAASASSSSSSLNSTLGALNNASLNVSAATKQPFTLQKPPVGAKRGKR